MKRLLTFAVLAVAAFACRKKDNKTQQCAYVPSYVDTIINLNDQNLNTLRTKGYAYLKGGYRGIIVHKESDTDYRAFERASTYQMAEVGCPLVVDSSLFFMVDPCSKSKFDFDGFIMQGPAICPLLEFKTSFVGSERLRIFYSL